MYKFGDIVENFWAADSNLTRRGIVIRTGNRTGRFNRDAYIELTDGKGLFWQLCGDKESRERQVKVGTIWGKTSIETEQELAKRLPRPEAES